MLKSFFNHKYIEAGVDEVGRGCLAGPVVAAAVILPKNFNHKLITDSKQLSAANRDLLEILIKKVAIAYSIAEIDNNKIDEVNILNASFLAMHKAIGNLKTRPEHLLIDGNRFLPYSEIPHTCIIKGDTRFLSIAAASILAKTYRDKLMINLSNDYPGYSWHTNFGYPTKAHRHGIKNLGTTKFHRKSFTLLKV